MYHQVFGKYLIIICLRLAKSGSFIDTSALSSSTLCFGMNAIPTAAFSTMHKSDLVSPTAIVDPVPI
jgi:hypothetical protein